MQGILTEWANAFTTGSNSGGYTLASVRALFLDQIGSTPGDITVAIHAKSGVNPAASALMTLSGSNPATAGAHEFTCANNCYLAANTDYFVVMSAPNATGNNQYYVWRYTSSDDETKAPSGNGWSLADAAQANQNGWIIHNDRTTQFRIAAYETSVGLTATASNSQVVLTLSNGPANWWFRIDTAGSCTAASGTRYPATGGIGGYTGYHTVTAYSNNTCTTEMASASFTV